MTTPFADTVLALVADARKREYLEGYRPVDAPPTASAALAEKWRAMLGEQARPALPDRSALDGFGEQTGYALPSQLEAALLAADGGGPYLSAEQVLKEWQSWKQIFDDFQFEDLFDDFQYAPDEGRTVSAYWTPWWVPFCDTGAGNFLAVDLLPGPAGTPGQIIAFGADETKIRWVAADLEDFCDQVLAGGDPAQNGLAERPTPAVPNTEQTLRTMTRRAEAVDPDKLAELASIIGGGTERIVYVDWKCGHEDIAWLIGKLRGGEFSFPPEVPPKWLAYDLLEWAQALLWQQRCALVMLGDEGDSLAFCLVSEAVLPRVLELGDALGLEPAGPDTTTEVSRAPDTALLRERAAGIPPTTLTKATLKKRVTQLGKLLASDEPESLEAAVDLGPEALAALLAAIPDPAGSGTGLGFRPGWRVKQPLWPRIQRRLAAVVMAYWPHEALEAYRASLHRWLPPACWREDLLPPDAVCWTADGAVPLVRSPAGRGPLGTRSSDSPHTAEQLREVAVTRDLWVSATLVTGAQWAAVLGADRGAADRAVIVSHDEAIAFCNALSAREGLAPAYVDGELAGPHAEGFRLLTEAEWERAARAGTETATYAGDLKNDYGANPTLDCIARNREGRSATRPEVATRVPNALGLYDMLGGGWERCQDVYGPQPADGVDPLYQGDDLPPEAPRHRVRRGGDWFNHPCLCIAGTRMSDDGRPCTFRVARKASESRAELAATTSRAKPAVVSPWDGLDVALELEKGHPRALLVAEGRFFIAVQGSQAGMNGVLVGDLARSADPRRLKTLQTPCSLALAGRTLYAGLGPGPLVAFAELGDGEPREVQHLPHTPLLASCGDDLLVGASGWGLRCGDTQIAALSSRLTDCAIDAERIYAAHEDKKIRVYDRATGARRRGMLKGESVAVAPGRVYGAVRKGTVTCYKPNDGSVLGSFEHQKGCSWSVRVRVAGERVLTHDGSAVQVQDLDGAPQLRWKAPKGNNVADLAVAGSDLLVAIWDYHGGGGRVLRFPLG